MPTIRDDRGRAFPTTPTPLTSLIPPQNLLVTDRVPHHIQVGILIAFSVLWPSLAFVTILLAREAARSTSFDPSGNGRRFPVWLPLCLIGLTALSIRSLYDVATGNRRRRVCLREEVCPICIYELRGLEADSNNQRICPECGAAWNSKLPSR